MASENVNINITVSETGVKQAQKNLKDLNHELGGVIQLSNTINGLKNPFGSLKITKAQAKNIEHLGTALNKINLKDSVASGLTKFGYAIEMFEKIDGSLSGKLKGIAESLTKIKVDTKTATSITKVSTALSTLNITPGTAGGLSSILKPLDLMSSLANRFESTGNGLKSIGKGLASIKITPNLSADINAIVESLKNFSKLDSGFVAKIESIGRGFEQLSKYFSKQNTSISGFAKQLDIISKAFTNIDSKAQATIGKLANFATVLSRFKESSFLQGSIKAFRDQLESLEGTLMVTGAGMKNMGQGLQLIKKYGADASKTFESLWKVFTKLGDKNSKVSAMVRNAATGFNKLGDSFSNVKTKAGDIVSVLNQVTDAIKNFKISDSNAKQSEKAIKGIKDKFVSLNKSAEATNKKIAAMSKKTATLSNHVRNASKSMNTFATSTTTASGRMNKLSNTMSKARTIARRTKDMFDNLHGVLIGIISVRMISILREYTDGWIELRNSVALGVKEIYNVSPVMERLYDIAQRTRTELDPISKLFRRMSLASDQLGASYLDMLKVTETITKALKISGSSTQESARAIEQLAQAFSEGVIKAKDFRSIISQAPRIIKALADELTAGDIGKLKTLLGNDAFTIKEIFGAILNQSGKIDDEFTNVSAKISDGMTKITNAFKRYVGQLNESTGLATKLFNVMSVLADNIDLVAKGFTSLALVALTSVIVKYSHMVGMLGGFTSLVFVFVQLYDKSEAFKNIIDGLFDSFVKVIKKGKEWYNQLTTTEDGVNKLNESLKILEQNLDDIISIAIGAYLSTMYYKFGGIAFILKKIGGYFVSFKIGLLNLSFIFANVFIVAPLALFLGMLVKIVATSKLFRQDMIKVAKAFNEWVQDSPLLASIVNGLKDVWNAAKNIWNIFSEMSGDELYIRFKYGLEQTYFQFMKYFGMIGDGIFLTFNGLWSVIIENFVYVADKVRDIFQMAFGDIMSFGKNLGNQIYKIVNKGASWTTLFDVRSTKSDLKKHEKLAKDYLKRMGKTFKEGVANYFDVIGGTTADKWQKKYDESIKKMNATIKGLPKQELTWEVNFTANSKKIEERLKKIADDFNLLMQDKYTKMIVEIEIPEPKMTDMTGVYPPYEGFQKEQYKPQFSLFEQDINGVRSGLQRMRNEWADVFKDIEQWTINSFDKIGDAFWNFIEKGEFGWRQLALTAVKELNKIFYHQMINSLFDLAGDTVTGSSNVSGFSFFDFFNKQAIGGSVRSGQPTMVGEHGAELFIPSSNGQIITNNSTSSMMSQAPEVKINQINAFDSESIANAVLSTPAGVQQVINIIAANKRKVGIRS